jgi:hypothetical protein
VKTVDGLSTPFYPYHAIKDTLAIAVVFALLLTLAVAFNAPLDTVADPTDATYVPRPEWYFMSLFELLKHFPGRLEPVATIVIPGLVVALLFLLPFIDTRPERAPRQRPLVIGSFIFVFAMITLLTVQGFRTTPSPAAQSPQAIAQGRARAAGQVRGPVMVEDVFKNVQALKGITVDEFMGTMGLMSASLGLVMCVGKDHAAIELAARGEADVALLPLSAPKAPLERFFASDHGRDVGLVKIGASGDQLRIIAVNAKQHPKVDAQGEALAAFLASSSNGP